MRIITGLVILAALMVFASTVSAIPFSTVLNGDNLVDWGTFSNSSDDTENKFIADYLGVEVSVIPFSKLSNSSGLAWEEVTGGGSDDLWAFDFGIANPAYFLIKTGGKVGLIDTIDGGSSETYSHFLYKNVDSLQYGVINLNDFTKTSGGVEIGIVSHVGVVPEPGTMLLLGSGLAGLGLFRKKLRKK
jgi:hypothetical protein